MVQVNRHCPEQQICVLVAAFSMHEETEVWTPELFVKCCTFYPDGDLHLSSLLSSTLALMTGVSNVAEVCPSTVPRSLVIVVTASKASDWSVLSPHPSCTLIGPASRCRRPFPDRPQKLQFAGAPQRVCKSFPLSWGHRSLAAINIQSPECRIRILLLVAVFGTEPTSFRVGEL